VRQPHVRHRILILGCTVVLLHGAGHLTGRASELPVLRIELIVFGGLGERQIEAVRHEVEAIWTAQGVTIEWPGEATAPRVRVVIDRPVPAFAPDSQQEQWHVAATRVIDGRVTPPICVSLDAAERVVRAANPPYSAPALAGLMVPRVVGRAIAHELAHFLLNTRAHTLRGLLRARFTADDFVSPARDAFNLDRGQIAVALQHQVVHGLPQ
jgi:hypothetical protein